MNALPRAKSALLKALRTVWAVIWRACIKYDETDGEQRAASFAYYAFFALFPLLVLLISVATTFVADKERVIGDITHYVTQYIPALPEEDIEKTINGVLRSRSSASFIALAVLAWTAVRFFHALVRGVNRAWGTKVHVVAAAD